MKLKATVVVDNIKKDDIASVNKLIAFLETIR